MQYSKKKIIIVGAGIAGLAASAKLQHDGFDVLVLEARDKVGGRACTRYDLGVPVSAGAGWIHGIDNNPMALLAQHFQAKMVNRDRSRFIYFDRHHQVIPNTIVEQFEEKLAILLHKAKEFSFQQQDDISLADSLTHFIAAETLSEIEHDLLNAKLTFFQGYIGENYEKLSARYWDMEQPWPGENCLLRDTYQPIVDGLATHCSVKLNTVVTEINLRAQDVAVVTQQETFLADVVLITVPLGVLKEKAITFNPPLPAKKTKAIQALGMGLLDIIAIKFPEVFWPQDAQALIFTKNSCLTVATFFNLYELTGQPILLGYVGGQTARQLENKTDNEIITDILQNLHIQLNVSIPQPLSYFVTRWAQDPFSYGSYSYVAIDATAADFLVLAETVAERLFFAGEATSDQFLATTHGAYLSGIREASKIKNAFGND